jgi:hypothetical protein
MFAPQEAMERQVDHLASQVTPPKEVVDEVRQLILGNVEVALAQRNVGDWGEDLPW